MALLQAIAWKVETDFVKFQSREVDKNTMKNVTTFLETLTKSMCLENVYYQNYILFAKQGPIEFYFKRNFDA